MRKVFINGLSILILLSVHLRGSSQPFALLKEINAAGASSNPTIMGKANGFLYFSADDGVNGVELWKTDGTAAGTVLVKDINPGNAGSNPSHFIYFNSVIYFFANNGTSGNEMWKTDGTESGTVLFKDINPGPGSSDGGPFQILNNNIFFGANDGVHGEEIWKSDGTVIGTSLLKDIHVGNLSSGSTFSDYPTIVIGNIMYFAASDGGEYGNHGTELWKTDGTEAGTVMIKNINPQPEDVFPMSSNPQNFTELNGALIFSAQDYGNWEPWKSDGTLAGTAMIKNIYPGLITPFGHGQGNNSFANEFTKMNGLIYFSAQSSQNDYELWKTDGTEAGTVRVKDINPGLAGSSPTGFTPVNGQLLFKAWDGTDIELWKTDGTESGTTVLKQINPTAASDPVFLGVLNNTAYFSADNGSDGRELWSSNGTEAGTTLVQNFEPGSGSSNPSQINGLNGKTFVVVNTTANGRELWVANDVVAIPLPLTLLEFKGAITGDDAKLQWKTDNELNTKSFAIERSTDGRHFSPVGNVNAANLNGVHNYDYTDGNIKSLGSSIIYYRLRQVDVDFKSTYSRIVALTLDKQKSFAMLYPNPVRKDINLTITLAKKEKLNWQLTDNNGRIIRNGHYELGAGSTAVVIDGGNLATGNYLLRLNGEQLQQTIKIVKQ